MKKMIAATVAALGLALFTPAPAAQADYDPGCETVGWGLNIFGSWTQRRTICDGPRNPDGAWHRARVIWTPAHYRPARSSCGTYSCTYTEGGYVPETIQGKEVYTVFDHNIPPNEPGWLPPGTDIIRS